MSKTQDNIIGDLWRLSFVAVNEHFITCGSESEDREYKIR